MFSKMLSARLTSKLWKIFILCLRGKLTWKYCFCDILDRKKAFLDNSGKIRLFLKGLVHDFGMKFEKFPLVVFGKFSLVLFFYISDENEVFLNYKNVVLNSRGTFFFLKSCVQDFVKNINLLTSLFLGKIWLDILYVYIVDRNEAL